MPTQNRQIITITSLYADAERSLQALVAEASYLPQTPDRLHVTNRITAHISLLQTFQKADRFLAKFLGFVVTWGTVKTIFLTLFTLGVGLASILKGIGVFFTVQSVCPVHY